MSDVGIVPLSLLDDNATLYLLPISPSQILQGILFNNPARNKTLPAFRSQNLTLDEAEYVFDCICASGVTEIICSRQLPGIAEGIGRAREKGIVFQKIIQPERIATAGLIDVGKGDLYFQWVPTEEYVRFVHSYIQPNA